jgi:hypothetical protein
MTMTMTIAQCSRNWRKPISTALDDVPSRLQSWTARGRSKVGRLAIAVFLAGTQTMLWVAALRAESLAPHVADGKPWHMFYPERNTTGSLTLKPDGTGVLLNGAVTLQPEWRATSDGLCMRPALLIPERCFKLLINGSSIDGIEDEKLVFRLFR